MKVRGEVCYVKAKTNHPVHREILGMALITSEQRRVYINLTFLYETAIWEAQQTIKGHADLLADSNNACVIQSWELSDWVPFIGRTREQPHFDPLGRRERAATQ